MRRVTWVVLLLVFSWLIWGCAKGKETATSKEGLKHEAAKGEAAK